MEYGKISSSLCKSEAEEKKKTFLKNNLIEKCSSNLVNRLISDSENPNPLKKCKIEEIVSRPMEEEASSSKEFIKEMDENTSNHEMDPKFNFSDNSEDFDESYLEETDSESDDQAKVSWAGDPLSSFTRLSAINLNVPRVAVSSTHKVYVELPLKENQAPTPYPSCYMDKWNFKYVRMPNSQQSMYPVKQLNGKSKVVQRWPVICEAYEKPITSMTSLYYAIISYNQRYKNRWRFEGLAYLLEEEFGEEEQDYFFKILLPKIIKLAMSLPSIVTRPPYLLSKKQTMSLSLSQKQISCLLANAFLCTFPRRNARGPNTEYATYPDINFSRLFRHKEPSALEKMKCIIHYFKEVLTHEPDGMVTFTRQYISPEEMPNFEENSTSLPKFMADSKGLIEETPGLLQVDFANKYIGGGVLGLGCVQEEIRFVLCPELLVSLLFTEVLDKNEALIVTGVQQYSKCKGYASSFEWVGACNDLTPQDTFKRRLCQLVGLDALSFPRNPTTQYKPNLVLRELRKAYVGFRVLDNCGGVPVGIASGNWGCGVFHGDAKLKSLIQLAAAGAAHRDLAYFTFGNKKLRDTLVGMHRFLVKNKVSIGQLVMVLCQYGVSKTNVDGKDLYDYIKMNLSSSSPETTDSDNSLSIIECSQPTVGKVDEKNKTKGTIKHYFKSVFKPENSKVECDTGTNSSEIGSSSTGTSGQ